MPPNGDDSCPPYTPPPPPPWQKTVSDMHEGYATEHTFSGGVLFREFDPDGVVALLERMTPGNSRVRVTARDCAAKCTLSER